MAYELWDRESANMVGAFDSEAQALAFVRSMIEANGPAVTRPWALAIEDADGETTALAADSALHDRALNDATATRPPIAR